jgi:hypothetical protein
MRVRWKDIPVRRDESSTEVSSDVMSDFAFRRESRSSVPRVSRIGLAMVSS